MLRRLIAFLCLAWLAAVPALAADRPVTVFAAASLKNALDEVGVAYAAKTSGAARFSYAGSSAIARQIEQGAPADVYISADSDWMDYLAGKKLIVPGSRRDLLTNHLALIAPADAKVSLKIGKGMRLALALGAGRLAVAGPDVPAGRYAKASLIKLGAWNSVSGKLVQAENVRAALQFVARGEAPLGIVYDTDAKVEPRVRIVGLFPDASHPPIVYPAALVAGGRNPRAQAFLAFLRGPEARAVFRKYGFVVLPRR
ncbi:MAG: molybdate ABC transporter substrate-binding protein [Phenylobacterium sp.]|uniref:molybdate ABC transporter substrate-binding protein n=1 Tax=Phenylobacterium sp. TaxID=1871053 RepID=UPI001B495199|nr:molybdate ABC transporter substrate-binding protein [Phenylobacterium sp.]MBP7651654.1 molybdate ABC transporter substrate-binding protein [Phenylobacterium sp.]MBP7814741.1 molybdate ABC transporter substrate-binding protein [Phenylobacterium sp.]MBP9230661.1 molybdate ABC transporter substrate-binding protein [Phenylobacterium sp.]MBP9754747.1 molybdate ABC transporter substrate-binding protein [Phenylobacterium sp.]